MDLQDYHDAIRERVCTRCIDGDGEGNCRLQSSTECPLMMHLPMIVNAVNRVSSDRVEDYVSELRAIVCTQCSHQTADGRCTLRTFVECGLDRYFPLVVEAIESVNMQKNN